MMTKYLTPQIFTENLISNMLKKGIRGGQHLDGSQKDGFFHYEEGKAVSIYDMETGEYVPCAHQEPIAYMRDSFVKPEGCLPWKTLSQDPDRQKKIASYFAELEKHNELGVLLAKRLLQERQDIAHGLVRDEVAHSIADVETVLQYGFFHLYTSR
jgi:hypothetical protein